jgi:membrane protein YdbS with pleckstrin-like domain
MNETVQTKVSRSKFSTKRLVSGEQILWEGRPSVIVYFLRSLLLTIFGLVFAVSAFIQSGIADPFSDLESYIFLLIMVILALLMFVLHRRWGVIEGIIAVIVIAVVMLDVQGVTALYFVPMIIGLMAFVVEYMVWSHTYFAISDRRIMTQTGIFSLKFVDTQIDRIQNVSVVQPFVERILGYGDVMFATAGEMGGIDSDAWNQKMGKGGAIVWDNIPHPFEVRKIAENIIFHATRPQVQYVPQAYAAVPPQAPASPSFSVEATERLAKLKEMRDKNFITEDEYQKKRQEIIGQL